MKVIVESKEFIVPSSPTPLELKTYKLSHIDQLIPPYYISTIHYYLYDESESTNITQSQMTNKLKTSLSKALTHFYPLAGRLSANRNTVDCSDQGVQFLVGRVYSNLSDIIKDPIIKELNQLAMVETSYVEEQLAIQVNLFDCGGLVVGVSISHRIMDICSLSAFVTNWFAMTKGSKSPLAGPILDSAVLFPPVESHEYTRNPKYPTIHVPLTNLVTKRFVFSSLAINKLKRQVEGTHLVKKPTRVEVVTALIWKCGTMALAGDRKASSVAFHVINFRKRTVPLLQDYQIGNLFQMAGAVATYDQTADMASLVTKLRSSIGKIDNDYLQSIKGQNGYEIARGNFREIRKYMIDEGVGVVLRFSSLCRYALNDPDFGWGKPVWFTMANLGDENSIIFTDSRQDDGIEAWVVMNEVNMKKFEKNDELQEFVGYSNQPIRPSSRL